MDDGGSWRDQGTYMYNGFLPMVIVDDDIHFVQKSDHTVLVKDADYYTFHDRDWNI